MSTIPSSAVKAAKKYGPMVDGIAKRYGLKSGAKLLLKLAQGESNFNMGAVSSAGARGATQFMPGSRQTAISKYGIDPWRSMDEAMRGAALHLLGRINGSTGLEGYNPGSPSYRGYILGQQLDLGGVNLRKGEAKPPGQSKTYNVRKPGKVTPGTPPSFTPGSVKQNITGALLDSLLARSSGQQRGSLLQAAVERLNTGAYDTVIPAQITDGKKPKYMPGKALTVKTGGAGRKRDVGGVIKPQQVTQLKGITTFEGKQVAAWVVPILQYARQRGWKGTVTSGWRSDADQKRIYDSGVRPAAVPRVYGGGGSNHQFKAFPGGAVDVSDAASLSSILRKSPYAKLLVWAGAKDPVHFSKPHNGSY